jgi:hypothetical protein
LSPFTLFNHFITKKDKSKYALIIAEGFKRLMEKGNKGV